MDNKRLLITAFLIFLAYQIVNRILRTDVTQGGTSPEDIKPGTDLTYSNNEYILFADTIESAFWDTFGNFTEDDELAFEVLSKMQTNDDFYKLVKVYGTRGRGLIIVDAYNLIQSIEILLDNEYKEQLNNLYSQRGIKYQFSKN
jgi:hypothetical protein